MSDHDNWKDEFGQALADAILFVVDDKTMNPDWFDSRNVDAVRDELLRTMPVPSESVQFPVALPIDMVLHCPKCHLQHIDAPEWVNAGPDERGRRTPSAYTWTNPPHRSHLCSGCGHIWRPADVCTNGVAAVKTVGKNDSPIVLTATPEINVEAEQLALIGQWDHRGDSVAEAADEHFGVGAWARLLKRIRR